MNDDITRCECGGRLTYFNCGAVLRRCCDGCTEASGFVPSESVPAEFVLGALKKDDRRAGIPRPYCSSDSDE